MHIIKGLWPRQHAANPQHLLQKRKGQGGQHAASQHGSLYPQTLFSPQFNSAHFILLRCKDQGRVMHPDPDTDMEQPHVYSVCASGKL